jgi:hypothetical protein
VHSFTTIEYRSKRPAVPFVAKIPIKIGLLRPIFATRILNRCLCGDFAEIYPAVPLQPFPI